jgi:hypothetical protein
MKCYRTLIKKVNVLSISVSIKETLIEEVEVKLLEGILMIMLINIRYIKKVII